MYVYIGFSYPKDFKIGARAISWWCETPYSHVYLRFSYDGSKDAIFHAAHGMVHFKSIPNFQRDNLVIKEYKIELTEKEHSDLFDECMGLAGETYSVVTLGKIFASDVTYKVCQRTINWKDSPGYICSELVGKLCVEQLKIQFNKPKFLLKPLDIDLGLQNSLVAKLIIS